MNKEEAGRNVDPNHTESAKTAVLSPQSSTARTNRLKTRSYKTGLNQRCNHRTNHALFSSASKVNVTSVEKVSKTVQFHKRQPQDYL